MNMQVLTSWNVGEGLDLAPNSSRSDGDIADRLQLARDVAREATAKGFSKSETAKRVGMPVGTFTQWLNGKYAGRLDNQNEKARNWLRTLKGQQEVERSLPREPKYIETRLAKEIAELAETARQMPGICLVAAEAGLGKTFAAREILNTRAGTFLMTASPNMRTTHSALVGVAEAVGLDARGSIGLVGKITAQIQSRSIPNLLIVDEAQNLRDDAINQLRHFVDDPCKCGLLLLGNSESYSRSSAWANQTRSAQLHRRIFRRINLMQPYLEDLKMFIKTCEITDPKMVQFLTGVGMKPGALGQVDMTVRLAKMLAIGSGKPLSLELLQKAWKNRDTGISMGGRS